MQYNQPYGVTDTNAPYINGNPSTGTMGSIPPAASIEYPQREIVNLITDAGLVPDNGDLHQLAKGVQSGQLIFGVDVGAVNAVSIAVNPPLTALTKGMSFLTIFANDNTGPATASVSGLPFIQIVHPTDRTPLNPLELRAGSFGCLAYDGTYFQLAWSSTAAAGIGAPVFLTAPLTYYVGGAGASDNNDGTTAAVVVGTKHGPFATLQQAMNTIANFNLNGHNITINVADGTYPYLRLGAMAGSGWVYWNGDAATPGNCVISGTNVSAVVGQACGGAHQFNGFAVQSNGTFTNDPMCGFSIAGTGTTLQLYNIQWNQCNGSHLACSEAAIVALGGKQIINGSALGGNPYMTTGWHIFCTQQAIVGIPSGAAPSLQINGSVGGGNGGGFISATSLAYTQVAYSSITGAANWGGYKYQVETNSIMTSLGGGASYYPGSVAGTQSYGGQYF